MDFDDVRNPLLGAGQARATVEVGSRLHAMGHTVLSLCSRYPGSVDRTEHGIMYRHVGLGSSNIKLNNIAYILLMPFILPFLRGDIIIECFTAPMSVLCSPLFTRIPVVGLPTSFDADRFAKYYHLPLLTTIEKFGSKLYRYFLPYTKNYDDKMKQYNPAVISRIVPEGVCDTFFHIPRRSPKHILCMGRLDINQKGLDMLLAAYDRVADSMPYPLLIVGSGPDEKRLTELISTYRSHDRIFMRPATFGKEKELILAHAAYVCMPSRNEGFSLFSLEALASGLPVLCFTIPGFSWADSPAVVKIPAFSVDGYAQMLRSMTDKTMLNTASKASRPLARRYTWDNVASQFDAFFDDVVHNEVKRRQV